MPAPFSPEPASRPEALDRAGPPDPRALLPWIRDQLPAWRARLGLPQSAPDCYTACDLAWLSGLCGEDLRQVLSPAERESWIRLINSYQDPSDGSYQTFRHHSKLHANGMAVGALGVLGGRMRFEVKLYRDLDTPERALAFLERIDWRMQWSASHFFWGGIHCFSLLPQAAGAWLEAVFGWLDENLEPGTGWWRKGVAHADRHQALGGAAHILPIYQHHGRAFPFPRQLLDSVLAMQLPNGRFHQVEVAYPTYLDLDALYALDFGREQAPGYRAQDLTRAAARLADSILADWPRILAWMRGPAHPHEVLGCLGAVGLLQRFLPDTFSDSRPWSDIFSDRRFYQTAAVAAQTGS